MPDVATMVSALSVMLGAYAFFYNAYSPRIREGEDVGPPAANRTGWARQMRTLERARTTARALAGISLLVFVVFIPEVWERVDAVAANPTFDRYSTLDVVFMLLACSWLTIAILVWRQALGLSASLARLRAGAPPE